MVGLICSVVLVLILTALLQAALGKYEPGRSFQALRIWVAATIFVTVFQGPLFAGIFIQGREADHTILQALAEMRGSMMGLVCLLPALFGVQWIVYRAIVKDTGGRKLSRRGNLLLAAAVPTLMSLALSLVFVLLLAGLFYAIAE